MDPAVLASARSALSTLSGERTRLPSWWVALWRRFAEARDARRGIPNELALAEAALAGTVPASATLLARGVLTSAESEGNRARARRLLAWIAIGERDAAGARRWLLTLPDEAIDPLLVAAYLDCAGDDVALVAFLDEARARGACDVALARLHVEGLLRLGLVDRAVTLARDDRLVFRGREAWAFLGAVIRASRKGKIDA